MARWCYFHHRRRHLEHRQVSFTPRGVGWRSAADRRVGAGRAIPFATAVCVWGGVTLLCGQPPAQPRRQAPPDWHAQGDEGVFFRDAFQEALQGPRPDALGAGPPRGGPPEPANAPTAGWSQWVTAEVLEQEVKRLATQLRASVQQPASFASGGYQQAQQQFSQLATFFAVIHEYEGPVRWKSQAAAARDHFARLAQTTRVTSASAYQAAKAGREQLDELLRGNPWPHPTQTEVALWPDVADRKMLMSLLETSFDETLRPAVADDRALRRNAEPIRHQAQLIRLLGEILLQPDMEDAADAEYAAYVRQMQSSAGEILHAAAEEDGHAVRQAAGRIHTSCGACHDLYRG